MGRCDYETHVSLTGDRQTRVTGISFLAKYTCNCSCTPGLDLPDDVHHIHLVFQFAIHRGLLLDLRLLNHGCASRSQVKRDLSSLELHKSIAYISKVNEAFCVIEGLKDWEQCNCARNIGPCSYSSQEQMTDSDTDLPQLKFYFYWSQYDASMGF